MANAKKQKTKHSSQGPFTIWHGMTVPKLIQLLSMRPPMHWSRAGRIALLPPLAVYNSTMKLVESVLYGKKIRETEPVAPPLFILGYWRSGTTLLHNLMTSDPQFTYMTLYQSVFPWHFLTTQKVVSRLTSAMLPDSRPMDNISVKWDAAQEDEVALCVMTLVSPYLLVAFDGDRERYRPSLFMDSLPPKQLQEWKDALNLVVKKLTVNSPKQIILKSPSHTFRVKTLVEMFPDAKFVYIYRNPYDVFNSNVHLRTAMTTENNFDKPSRGEFHEEILDLYMEGFKSYQENKHLIRDGHLYEMKYEDLAADPLREMERTYEALNLSNVDGMRAAIEPQVEELKKYKKNKFTPDPIWQQRVYDAWREAYEEFGYPAPASAGELTEVA